MLPLILKVPVFSHAIPVDFFMIGCQSLKLVTDC